MSCGILGAQTHPYLDTWASCFGAVGLSVSRSMKVDRIEHFWPAICSRKLLGLSIVVYREKWGTHKKMEATI